MAGEPPGAGPGAPDRDLSAAAPRGGELPDLGLELEETSIDVALPTDRPLFTARPAAEVNSLLDPVATEEVDTSVLTDQVVVEPTRLEDIVTMYPVQHGTAEIVGYLALKDDDLEVTTNEDKETVIQYHEAGRSMRAVLPWVEIKRR